jgi:uncharacterized protein YydD (DUF2326 family)
MIHALRANRPSFVDITFSPGFNVILADRTKESTRHDTRNGLGKSTFVELLHFCLGSSPKKGRSLLAPALAGWEFSLDFDAGRSRIVASRSTSRADTVDVQGDTAEWPVQPTADAAGERRLPVNEWVAVLGQSMFGIPFERGRVGAAGAASYGPSFRSLISYSIRRGRDGFLSPFEHHRRQPEWDKQLHNTFLLGLAWEDVRDWQELRDKKKALANLQDAMRAGLGGRPMGRTVGELEASKVRLERQVEEEAAALAQFRVHEQYKALEGRVNTLTQDIHAATNDNVFHRELLTTYEASAREERPPAQSDVGRLYQEAGVALPGAVRQRLADVQIFHDQVVANRRAFLQGEMGRLERAISARDGEIRRRSDERAELMQLLATHGALEEYTRLERLHMANVQSLRQLEAQIAQVRQLQQGKSAFRVEQETLQQRAQLDYDARRIQRDQAIKLFTDNSQALYAAPGNLIIDITENGFRFDVEIERSDSQGIGNMKVFCYDVMLACLWAQHEPTPGFLVHDSTIFADVDERQVALALELAARRAEEFGFQYICTLNSDAVPWDEFSPGFDFEAHVRRRLTDASEDGSLLGTRF